MAVLAGIHAVKHALDAGETIDELLIEKGKSHPRINELIHLAKKAGIRFTFVPKEALVRLAEGVPHQGVVAKVASAESVAPVSFEMWLDAIDMDRAPLLLLLDQVTDPHNLGACIRTAEAAGCLGVIVMKDHAADVGSPVVAKAACGALSRLPLLRVTNMKRCIEQLQKKGFWTVGLAGEADTSIYDVALTGATAVVMGSEGAGLRRLVGETCDQLLRIPMPGSVESLNVSVATGVALFEVTRQRLKAGPGL
ncbi:23S rRNA (guanosine(2251)-2'-O)-methyltransferase RlmB [Mariprofundus erugo]|uniref:23S rRNA (Guanosine(2251)-2'-O)-methyltransferase RlmB n=1 Tax=Mariprofundus erugo TaxID=2528639 RepID=A0A5R9GJQ7_9PROT|nr:23S rRNA (guanosine(2251)-2'-O)-methyltransferase RlmB [Mariprofundus erugo]TLS65309.1 23S rRNA (guanosine(2251)-2'-O)-methyltransferase RlmB [Mariprofundus erugo]TLS76842.1 23S rRNA (guanosine(2251)-2'-O)-methyltransferase RlmB [Mariprofundus erugo]